MATWDKIDPDFYYELQMQDVSLQYDVLATTIEIILAIAFSMAFPGALPAAMMAIYDVLGTTLSATGNDRYTLAGAIKVAFMDAKKKEFEEQRVANWKKLGVEAPDLGTKTSTFEGSFNEQMEYYSKNPNELKKEPAATRQAYGLWLKSNKERNALADAEGLNLQDYKVDQAWLDGKRKEFFSMDKEGQRKYLERHFKKDSKLFPEEVWKKMDALPPLILYQNDDTKETFLADHDFRPDPDADQFFTATKLREATPQEIIEAVESRAYLPQPTTAIYQWFDDLVTGKSDNPQIDYYIKNRDNFWNLTEEGRNKVFQDTLDAEAQEELDTRFNAALGAKGVQALKLELEKMKKSDGKEALNYIKSSTGQDYVWKTKEPANKEDYAAWQNYGNEVVAELQALVDYYYKLYEQSSNPDDMAFEINKRAKLTTGDQSVMVYGDSQAVKDALRVPRPLDTEGQRRWQANVDAAREGQPPVYATLSLKEELRQKSEGELKVKKADATTNRLNLLKENAEQYRVAVWRATSPSTDPYFQFKAKQPTSDSPTAWQDYYKKIEIEAQQFNRHESNSLPKIPEYPTTAGSPEKSSDQDQYDFLVGEYKAKSQEVYDTVIAAYGKKPDFEPPTTNDLAQWELYYKTLQEKAADAGLVANHAAPDIPGNILLMTPMQPVVAAAPASNPYANIVRNNPYTNVSAPK